MWEEKRQSSRRPVCVNIDAFPDPIPIGRLVDVSNEGLFVRTTNLKEIGTRIDLCFTPPNCCDKIRLTAEVMWVNYPPSSDYEQPLRSPERFMYKSPGMGLRVISISPEDKVLMEKFIQEDTM